MCNRDRMWLAEPQISPSGSLQNMLPSSGSDGGSGGSQKPGSLGTDPHIQRPLQPKPPGVPVPAGLSSWRNPRSQPPKHPEQETQDRWISRLSRAALIF